MTHVLVCERPALVRLGHIRICLKKHRREENKYNFLVEISFDKSNEKEEKNEKFQIYSTLNNNVIRHISVLAKILFFKQGEYSFHIWNTIQYEF